MNSNDTTKDKQCCVLFENDIPFPKKVRAEIVAVGRAEPHHVLPDSGWISFYLNESADVEKAIGLFDRS